MGGHFSYCTIVFQFRIDLRNLYGDTSHGFVADVLTAISDLGRIEHRSDILTYHLGSRHKVGSKIRNSFKVSKTKFNANYYTTAIGDAVSLHIEKKVKVDFDHLLKLFSKNSLKRNMLGYLEIHECFWLSELASSQTICTTWGAAC